MRGEHSAPRGNDGMTLGSSPHARGARIADQVLASFTGDHPRMRGEHEPADRRGHDHDGIIPACAGSTAAGATLTFIRSGSSPHARGARERRLHRPPSGRDHPRMRGEHALGILLRIADQGIIPHARGARVVARVREPDEGSSPHARGARRGLLHLPSSDGSSPHARGAPSHSVTLTTRPRDHPACAGSTAVGYGGGFSITGSSPHARGARLLSCRSHHSPRDHPRMRGEHGRAAEPHAHLHGIIPACAGSTARQLLGRSL